jgi:hypothetical protein
MKNVRLYSHGIFEVTGENEGDSGSVFELGTYSKCYSRICMEELRMSTKHLTVTIAGVPAAIRTEPLLNTSIERYRYTNLSGTKVVIQEVLGRTNRLLSLILHEPH